MKPRRQNTPHTLPLGAPLRTGRRLAELLALLALWILSDLSYFRLLPVLGIRPNYNDSPVSVTLLYLFWLGVTVISFWPIYASWPRFSNWPTFQSRITSLAIWTVGFVSMVAFVAIVLPDLPPLHWPRSWGPPPELPLATSLYFLPKSIEILFQQLLMVAVVLLLAPVMPLRHVAYSCALLFGSAHTLLMFDAVSIGYVIRFTISALLFGAIFPLFILRIRNGLAFTYIIHWSYYALSILLARDVGMGRAMAFFKSLLGI